MTAVEAHTVEKKLLPGQSGYVMNELVFHHWNRNVNMPFLYEFYNIKFSWPTCYMKVSGRVPHVSYTVKVIKKAVTEISRPNCSMLGSVC